MASVPSTTPILIYCSSHQQRINSRGPRMHGSNEFSQSAAAIRPYGHKPDRLSGSQGVPWLPTHRLCSRDVQF